MVFDSRPTSPNAPSRRSEYANELMSTLEENFLSNIRALRGNAPQIGLAETQAGMQPPKSSERIRIAVLDTGVDLADTLIKTVKSRITEMRSWVGSPEDCSDNYGHGTHVARLLVKMAPTAEIFVAKITNGKNIEPENMSRIAKVSLSCL